MALKAVIFDFDGTLADSLPLCVAAFRKTIEPLAGRVVSDAEVLATFGPSEEGTIMALVPQHFEQGLRDYHACYREMHYMCPAPFEGILRIIAYLKAKGLRTALVTGKGAVSLDISLEYLGLEGAFELIRTGIPTGLNKLTGLREVLEGFGISPTEALYIGDMPGDVTASREAGMPVCAAAWCPGTDAAALARERPDYLLDSVAELETLLRSLAGVEQSFPVETRKKI